MIETSMRADVQQILREGVEPEPPKSRWKKGLVLPLLALLCGASFLV